MNFENINPNNDSKHFSTVVLVTVASICLCLFSFFINNNATPPWIGIFFLFIASVMLFKDIRTFQAIPKAFGFSKITKKVLLMVFCGILVGFISGVLYKTSTPLINTFSNFVFVAAAIGITEELIFRGIV